MKDIKKICKDILKNGDSKVNEDGSVTVKISKKDLLKTMTGDKTKEQVENQKKMIENSLIELGVVKQYDTKNIAKTILEIFKRDNDEDCLNSEWVLILDGNEFEIKFIEEISRNGIEQESDFIKLVTSVKKLIFRKK